MDPITGPDNETTSPFAASGVEGVLGVLVPFEVLESPFMEYVEAAPTEYIQSTPVEFVEDSGADEALDVNSLDPNQFYLSITYDAESGFSSTYIPIDSAHFEIPDGQKLSEVYFLHEEEYSYDYISNAITSDSDHPCSADSTLVPQHEYVDEAGAFIEIPASSPEPCNLVKPKRVKVRKSSKSRTDDAKLWDSSRTITLLQLMREREQYFQENVSKRVDIWAEISAEMQKVGYIDATGLSCAKKWYNISRKYKDLKRNGKSKKWYCASLVKYLIPIMKRVLQLPFTERSPPTKKCNLAIQVLREVSEAHSKKVLETLAAFKTERQKLLNEESVILEDIKQSLEDYSRREDTRLSDPELNTLVLASSLTSLGGVYSSGHSEDLLHMDNCIEMVELVDGENIIQTTSTTGEPIQLTICLDWSQLEL